MKKIILAVSVTFLLTEAQAQQRNTPVSIQAGTKPVMIKPTKINISPKVLAQKFITDLAVDDPQFSYDPVNKKYTLKCRIINEGAGDVDLRLLSYIAQGLPNTLYTNAAANDPNVHVSSTDMNIPFDVETEIPGGGVWLNGRNFILKNSSVLTLQDRGSNSVPRNSSIGNSILKPGEFVYATASDNAAWQNGSGAGGPHRIYSIRLDPLNKIGDNNLSNNFVSVTIDNYY